MYNRDVVLCLLYTAIGFLLALWLFDLGFTLFEDGSFIINGCLPGAICH